MPTATNTNSAPSSASPTSSVKRSLSPDALDDVGEARLVDRHAPGAQAVDLLWKHVANDDVVAEVGEARPGDEAHVARSEDRDPAHVCWDFAFFSWLFAFFSGSSGWRPFAIAIIVSFESELSSVLTTQYELSPSRSTIMWSFGPW